MVWVNKYSRYEPQYDLEFIDWGMVVKIYEPTWQAYYDSKKEGDLVPVHYLPIFPWFVYEDETNKNVILMFLFCSGFTIIFASFFTYLIAREWKVLSLWKATQGIVAPESSSNYFVIEFEEDSNNYQSIFRSRYSNYFNVGEKCIVLFDPNNPKLNQTCKVDFLFNWWKLSED